MALYINGKPLEASFATATSRVFPNQGSALVPILFTRPLTGTIRVELSGTAETGRDFQSFGTPVAGFEGITIAVQVTDATSTALSIPLVSVPQKLRGERRLSLILRGLATLTNGSTVNRTGSAAPGGIPSHTIIISEAEKTWSGTLEFPTSSGFGPLPTGFALSADGTLRMAVPDSRFFGSVSPGTGTSSPSKALHFTSQISGSYSPVQSGPQATWGMSITPAEPDPSAPDLLTYSAQLLIQNFPLTGITRSYIVPLTLQPNF
jgi:hypothetical protein